MCFASSCTLLAWFLSLAGIDLLLAAYISLIARSDVILSMVLSYFCQTSCHDLITRFVTSKKAHYTQHHKMTQKCCSYHFLYSGLTSNIYLHPSWRNSLSFTVFFKTVQENTLQLIELVELV